MGVSSGVSPGNAGFPGIFPGMGGPGGMDFGAFLNNPALMNMATTMLSDPNMQQMMGQMGGGMGGEAPGAGGQPGEPPASMESLLQAGQQLAQQMQASNPDLVEQLRRQMQGDLVDQEDHSLHPKEVNLLSNAIVTSREHHLGDGASELEFFSLIKCFII